MGQCPGWSERKRTQEDCGRKAGEVHVECEPCDHIPQGLHPGRWTPSASIPLTTWSLHARMPGILPTQVGCTPSEPCVSVIST